MARNKMEYDKAKVEKDGKRKRDGRRGKGVRLEDGRVSNRRESTIAMNFARRRGDGKMFAIHSFFRSFVRFERQRAARPLARFFSQNYVARIDRVPPLPAYNDAHCADLFFMRHTGSRWRDGCGEEGGRGWRNADADEHAWMFHEDTADRRKGDVITSGPQFCALRISALDRSKSRGQHGRSVSVTVGADRSDSSPLCARRPPRRALSATSLRKYSCPPAIHV